MKSSPSSKYSWLDPLSLLWICLLFAGVFVVYGGAVQHELLINWDDPYYITGNKIIRGFTPIHLLSAFNTFHVGNYAPLHIMSYMVDYELWHLRPSGIFLFNITLHALNACSYYWLLVRIIGSSLVPSAAAFIFAFHPVQVESVVWASQRKTLLAMLFFLAACHLYIYWHRYSNRLSYVCSIIAFMAAVLSKSVAVILPACLICYDFCCDRDRPLRKLVVDMIPFAVVAAAGSVMAVWSLDVSYQGATPAFPGTLSAKVLTMSVIIARYLGLVVWPFQLSALYDVQIRTTIDLVALFALAIILMLVAAAVFFFRRNRPLLCGLLVFMVGLLPVMQVVPLATMMNDRYLYFPLLGGAPLIAAGMIVVGKLSPPRVKYMSIAICISLLLALPYFSSERVTVWRNSLALWSDTVIKSPYSKLAWSCLGEAYLRRGEGNKALVALHRSLNLDPDFMDALLGVGAAYVSIGDFQQAYLHAKRLTELYPKFSLGFNLLSTVYYGLGDPLRGDVAAAQSRTLKQREKRQMAISHRFEPARNGLYNQ